MNITKRKVGNCVVLDCSGRIVLGPENVAVRSAVRDAADTGAKKIILNLGDVNYIDSSGIGELVALFTHVKGMGGQLVLLNLSKKIRELLVITKLHTVFEVFEDEPSALSGC